MVLVEPEIFVSGENAKGMKFQLTEKHKFLSILFVLQICVFVAFGIKAVYAPQANAGSDEHNLGKSNDLEHYYSSKEIYNI